MFESKSKRTKKVGGLKKTGLSTATAVKHPHRPKKHISNPNRKPKSQPKTRKRLSQKPKISRAKSRSRSKKSKYFFNLTPANINPIVRLSKDSKTEEVAYKFYNLSNTKSSDEIKKDVKKGHVGGGECNPITIENITRLERMMVDMYTDDFAGNVSGLVAEGGNNAVYSNVNFGGCTGDKYIVRMSSAAYDETNEDYPSVLREFIQETCYGIIASNRGIGPKIYKFGVMHLFEGVAFFSIIENLGEANVNLVIDKYREAVILEPEREPEMREVLKTAMDLVIQKNDDAGKAGFLMMDTKPPNSMIIPYDDDTLKAVLIDYDIRFTIITNRPDHMKFYSRVNIILYLLHAIVANEVPIVDTFMRELLKDNYTDYRNEPEGVNAETIYNFMNWLYTSNNDFKELWEHYKYNRVIRLG